MGRAKSYTKAIARQICEAIATSYKSIDAICNQNEKFPESRTFYRWLNEEANVELRHQYAIARERQADKLIQDIIDISDDSVNDIKTNTETGAKIINKECISRSKLRVDSRKWLAAKLAPKKFGAKGDITGAYEEPVVISMDLGNDKDF